jgi:hypothetical protein
MDCAEKGEGHRHPVKVGKGMFCRSMPDLYQSQVIVEIEPKPEISKCTNKSHSFQVETLTRSEACNGSSESVSNQKSASFLMDGVVKNTKEMHCHPVQVGKGMFSRSMPELYQSQGIVDIEPPSEISKFTHKSHLLRCETLAESIAYNSSSESVSNLKDVSLIDDVVQKAQEISMRPDLIQSDSVEDIDAYEQQIVLAIDTLKSTLAKKRADIVLNKAGREAAEKKQIFSRLYAKEEIRAIEALRAKIPSADETATRILIDSQVQNNKKAMVQAHARRLVELARAYDKKRVNYCKLLFMLITCAAYIAAMVLQKSGTNAFEIESRYQRNEKNPIYPCDESYAFIFCNSFILGKLMSSLPTLGEGTGFFHSSNPGSRGDLADVQDLYDWLNGTVFGSLYQDALCGDGVCSSPEEVPAVGRFGW